MSETALDGSPAARIMHHLWGSSIISQLGVSRVSLRARNRNRV